MGYVPKQTSVKVDFAGTGLEGLEISLRSMTVGAIKDLGRLMAEVDAKKDADDITFFDDVVGAFAGMIRCWNVEDDAGNPVEPTAGNIAGFDFVFFVLPAFQACAKALNGVDEGLGKGSRNGLPSAAGLGLPMEVLSASPGS